MTQDEPERNVEDSIYTRRIISHDEARAVAQRLINSHFHQEPYARVSIPVNIDYDDDILIGAYIEQQESLLSVSEKRAEEAERERDAAEQAEHILLEGNNVLRAERDSSQASLLRVVEALKPFAELADHPLCQGWKDWQPLWTAGRDEDNARIMFSDLRKARTALSPHTEKLS